MVYKFLVDHKDFTKEDEIEVNFSEIKHCRQKCPLCEGVVSGACVKELVAQKIITPVAWDEEIEGKINILVQYVKPSKLEVDRIKKNITQAVLYA